MTQTTIGSQRHLKNNMHRTRERDGDRKKDERTLVIAKTPTITYLRKSNESQFPLEYYAQVQGTIESMLTPGNALYDVETIDEIFSTLQHFLNLNYGRLYIYDSDDKKLVVTYGRKLDLAAIARGQYSVGEGVTGQAFLERQALYVKDLVHQTLYKGRSLKAQDLPYTDPAYLAVPFYGENLSGVVGFHLNARSRFDVISTIAIVSMIAEWFSSKQFECDRFRRHGVG